MNSSTIAIIPARGGSKGLVRKNLQEVGGKSLLEISVGHAAAANCFSRIIVSSDDEEILQVASSLGAEAVLRSHKASSDSALAKDYVHEFLMAEVHSSPDSPPLSRTLAILQPTSPLRTVEEVSEAIRLHRISGKPVVTVRRCLEHLEKRLTIDSTNCLSPAFGGASNPSGNRNPESKDFYPTGSIYVFSSEQFFEAQDIPIQGALPLITTLSSSIDVDLQEDLDLVRKVLAL